MMTDNGRAAMVRLPTRQGSTMTSSIVSTPVIIGRREDGRPIHAIMGGSGPLPTDPPPVTPPAPVTPPPPPAPTAPPRDLGFPADTPLVDMTDKEQVAYWKHHSRAKEDRLKSLGDIDKIQADAKAWADYQAGQLTDHEKAVQQAREEGRLAALSETNTMTVAAHVQAGLLARGWAAPDVQEYVDTVNTAAFITDGKVNVDKVASHLAKVAGPVGGSGSGPGGGGGYTPIGGGSHGRGGGAGTGTTPASGAGSSILSTMQKAAGIKPVAPAQQ